MKMSTGLWRGQLVVCPPSTIDAKRKKIGKNASRGAEKNYLGERYKYSAVDCPTLALFIFVPVKAAFSCCNVISLSRSESRPLILHSVSMRM